jgi:putative inorganic carbon (hco3(-)) transporter
MGTIDNLGEKDTGIVVNATATDSVSMQRHTLRRKPLVGAYVALLLFMVIYYARPQDWVPGLSHAPLAKVALILTLLALLVSLRHIRRRLPRETLYLGLLIGQLFLASALSPVWRGGAFQKTVDFAKVFVVVVAVAVAVNTSRRLYLIIFTQAASVAAIAAVTLWKGHLLLGRLDGLLGGNYSDPNGLALAFVISLPMCLALLFLTRSWIWKAAWTSAMLAMTFAIFLTGSRGGFLSLIATVAVCLWEFAIRGRRFYLLVLAALVAVLVVLSSGGMVIGRLKGTFNLNEDIAAANGSAQARQKLFWRSIEVTKEHPLFGVGPGNFEPLSGNWHVTHNSFTQLSSEGGILALVLYSLILWRGFRNVRATSGLDRRQTESRLLSQALRASLTGYVVGSLFASEAYQFYPYFLVAYTAMLVEINKKSASRSKAAETMDSAKGQNYEIMPESEIIRHSWN